MSGIFSSYNPPIPKEIEVSDTLFPITGLASVSGNIWYAIDDNGEVTIEFDFLGAIQLNQAMIGFSLPTNMIRGGSFSALDFVIIGFVPNLTPLQLTINGPYFEIYKFDHSDFTSPASAEFRGRITYYK